MSFDLEQLTKEVQELCLNPFGTGQCLSTEVVRLLKEKFKVSIPLEQGNVFRQVYKARYPVDGKVSIPLEQGNVFRHACKN